MSAPIVFQWLPNNPTAIVDNQDVTIGNSFVLNPNIPGYTNGVYIFSQSSTPQNVIRQISITSTNDDSTVTFVVSGIGCSTDMDGNPDQSINNRIESIVGTNAGVALSDNIYSQINSILPTNTITGNPVAVNGVSIGYAGDGITDYALLDYNRTIFQTSVQLGFNPQTSAQVTVYQSLDRSQIPNINFGALDNFTILSAFPVSVALTNATTDQIGTLLQPVTLTWATIVGATTDEIYFTVLQQGIR